MDALRRAKSLRVEAKGAGPDVAKAVVKELGIDPANIQWVVTNFSSLIPGLQANRFDMTAAEMAIRPERCQKVSYSEPGVLASLMVQHALYGNGSYGHPANGTPQSLPRITRAEVQRRPRNRPAAASSRMATSSCWISGIRSRSSGRAIARHTSSTAAP